MEVIILSTTWGTDSETDTHCGDVIFPLICDNQVFNWSLIAFVIRSHAVGYQLAEHRDHNKLQVGGSFPRQIQSILD